MNSIFVGVLSVSVAAFAALPGTPNYELRDYGFGAGGTAESGTANYSLEGIAGELSAQDGSTANYGLKQGLLGVQLAALPDAPTFQNPDDWYNKLELIINTSGNPADTLYAVAISDDDFTTTQYVQSDNTVGAVLGLEDFRTYSSWGSGSGINVIGLTTDTEYKAKVKAAQGDFTETAFGPESAASTAQASLIFDIDIDSSDTETAAPYSLDFGNLSPDVVEDSPQMIWLDIDSNAESGAFVYITSQNNGLLSEQSGHTIASVTGDLSVLSEGIGAQSVSVAESSGGPLAVESPYDGTIESVGAISGSYQQIFSSTAPLDDGRAAFLLKIKTNSTTPAGSYVDIYTVIATAAF